MKQRQRGTIATSTNDPLLYRPRKSGRILMILAGLGLTYAIISVNYGHRVSLSHEMSHNNLNYFFPCLGMRYSIRYEAYLKFIL
jgi:hypothetical protein